MKKYIINVYVYIGTIQMRYKYKYTNIMYYNVYIYKFTIMDPYFKTKTKASSDIV